MNCECKILPRTYRELSCLGLWKFHLTHLNFQALYAPLWTFGAHSYPGAFCLDGLLVWVNPYPKKMRYFSKAKGKAEKSKERAKQMKGILDISSLTMLSKCLSKVCILCLPAKIQKLCISYETAPPWHHGIRACMLKYLNQKWAWGNSGIAGMS